jgi:LuxR family maltose regulon positive regulatory protein
LLQTKFLIPRYGTELIPRPELLTRLQTAVAKRLTLLSAPPGYGKTTLLTELAAQSPIPCAWYQLDAADGDPTIFLSYLIACARQIEAAFFPDKEPALGQTVLALLEDSNPPPTERSLIVFINELAATLPDNYLIILEDYHLITNPDAHRLVNLLLESGPPQLHLVISSRTDPPLGLGRLRARGLLAEFRAPDLRFAADEVQLWLERVAPGTAVETARLLNEKTEGWAAALQIILSALSGKDAAGADQFVAELTGTQRYIFEYLAEEVFQQQPPEIQQFLMQTAVLDQMNAIICDALLDTHNAQLILDGLERDNQLIVSLDEQREWYRYHHLFRDFLLGKLRREAPERMEQLEEQAGNYYRQRGELEAAFAHFVRARKYDAAADVLAIFAREYVERGRVAVLQRYLGDLPDEVVSRYPELLLQHGNVLWRLGRGGTAVSRYEDARAAFAAQEDNAGVCRVLTQMAELARSQGDYRWAQKLAREALDVAAPHDHARRAKALMVLAKSEGFLTGMDRGHELGVESVAEARLAGDVLSRRARANLLRSLGHICWWYGDPETTLRYCQEALSLVSEESPIAANIYITISTPYVYRQDFNTARQYAERGLAIARQLQLPELLPRAHSNLGSILSRCHDMEAGESHLRQAVELAQGLGLESYARVMAVGYLAQNLCGQGRVDEARQLAEAILWERAANPDTYEMVVTRSVLADIALENDDLDEAQAIFESLEEIARRRQFRIPLAMIYFGLAYVHLRNGRTETAVPYAKQSVAILEPLNTWQLFLDQGERARIVCQALLEAGEETPFVTEVLRRLPGSSGVETGGRDTAVRVQCLGQFRVFVGDEEVTQAQWVSTKARDMLAYFITFRRKRIPLEKAAADIWPEQDQPGRAFHSALYRLRQALRRGSGKTKFVHVKSGEYWLDGEHFWIDVDEFETAVAAAARTPQEEAAQWRQKAIALYGGEYMNNLLYYDWVDAERQRLEEKFLQILAAAAADEARTENYPAALELINRAIRRDVLRENFYCLAMDYYAAAHDRSGLIRCYQRLAQELQEAFGLPPSPHTEQHYRQLLLQT